MMSAHSSETPYDAATDLMTRSNVLLLQSEIPQAVAVRAARYAVAAAGLSVTRRGAAGSNPTAAEVAEAIATQQKVRVHDGDDGLGALEAGS